MSSGDAFAGNADHVLIEAYRRRPGATGDGPYRARQAKRWLGPIAAKLLRDGRREFTASALLTIPRSIDNIVRGVIFGILLALLGVTAIGVVLWAVSLFSSFSLGHAGQKGSGDWHLPSLDAVMTPVYWAVSWILLLWHSLWVAVLPGSGQIADTDLTWVLSIIMLVVTLRTAMLPVFFKTVKAGQRWKAIQPQARALREKYRDDRERLSQETMNLMRRERANPLTGCLLVFVQLPVFYGLSQVLDRLDPDDANSDNGRYGWNATQFHSVSQAKLSGLPLVDRYERGASIHLLLVVVILVIVAATLSFQIGYEMTSRTGWAPDRTARMGQRLTLYGLPCIQFVQAFFLPVGTLIYIIIQSLFTLGQQLWRVRKYPIGFEAAIENRPARSFGLPFLVTYGLVAVITMGSGRMSDLAITAIIAGLVALVLAAAREGLPALAGGLGPARARRFLNDACVRGILTPIRPRYRFSEDWMMRELGIAYLKATGTDVPGQVSTSCRSGAHGVTSHEGSELDEMILTGEAAELAVNAFEKVFPPDRPVKGTHDDWLQPGH
jgi:membrane protein insertase, YidC/Oxa1 family, C-terminal domain